MLMPAECLEENSRILGRRMAEDSRLPFIERWTGEYSIWMMAEYWTGISKTVEKWGCENSKLEGLQNIGTKVDWELNRRKAKYWTGRKQIIRLNDSIMDKKSQRAWGRYWRAESEHEMVGVNTGLVRIYSVCCRTWWLVKIKRKYLFKAKNSCAICT